MNEELKACPFHSSDTCGCYDSVDLSRWDWNRRPIEDALTAEVAQLNHLLNICANALSLITNMDYYSRVGCADLASKTLMELTPPPDSF